MPSVLIAYSTVDGHTLTIGRRIQAGLERRGHRVTLMSVEDALGRGCAGFDRIVLGASIRYGKHRPAVYDFVARHRVLLARLPSAFFSVSAVARKKGKDLPAGNPYFRRFTQQSGWTPPLAAAFAGRIDYAKYGVVDRWVIRFIMWITRGPTDPRTAVDFTDWPQVDAFAEQVGRLAPPVAADAAPKPLEPGARP
jgi:menaquinone-dependent protoporphyrinogen oxidase